MFNILKGDEHLHIERKRESPENRFLGECDTHANVNKQTND